ncbi:hypothetical protein [Namhaeicola litoreus]|uniref:AI-2E family transporter n=1 Tax=Namhaeicola litoreus TaxID=1052145 RepID=A0ABW3Y087_9FLAO
MDKTLYKTLVVLGILFVSYWIGKYAILFIGITLALVMNKLTPK